MCESSPRFRVLVCALLHLFVLAVVGAIGTPVPPAAALAHLDVGTPLVPIFVARGVLPLPAGHGLDVTAASQLSLVTAAGKALPTQLDRCLELAGEVRSVELVAIATTADLPLRVERRTPPPTGFIVNERVLELLLHGFDFAAEGIDASYGAHVGIGNLALELGPVRSRARLNMPLRPLGTDAKLASLGWLRGTLTAYSGLPLVELDILWHTGEASQPVSEAFFRSLTLEMTPGWVAIPAAAQPWMARGPQPGESSVELVRDARAIGPDEWHTFGGQHAKALRVVLMHESVASFADLWRANSGRGQFRPSPELGTLSWWAGNPATPLSIDGFALPTLPPAALTRAVADIEAFRTRRLSGEAHPFAPYGRIGWFHPAGSPYGAMTSGEGIEHSPFAPELLCSPTQAWDYLWGESEAWLDRQGGWLFLDGEPLDVGAWMHANPSGRVNFSINPAAAGTGVANAWPTATQDPWKWRNAPRNGPVGSGGACEAALAKYGWVDPQHLVRLVRAWRVLVANTNDPLAKELIRCYAAAVRTDIAADDHPSASLRSLEKAALAHPGQGSVVNRAEGWAGSLQADDLGFNGTAAARDWLVTYVGLLRACQLPSGGLIAWDANKEATAYAKEESGGKDLAVTQSYQETILAWTLWLCDRLGIEGARDVLERQLQGLLFVYRAPGAAEPPYRLAVYPRGQPDLAVRTWSDVAALYASAEKSGYHHTVTLALALRLEVPGAMQATRDFVGGGDPLAVLLAANKYWGNRAALVSELQRRAGP